MQVVLAKPWTDAAGTTHPAGSVVDVDAATLAQLEAEGVVATKGGPGPTSTQPHTDGGPGPT